MSDTEEFVAPTYEELVAATLRALDISTQILAAADDLNGEEASQVIATAHLTVAGAQVFATLAQATAERDGYQQFKDREEARQEVRQMAFERRPPFRPTVVPND